MCTQKQKAINPNTNQEYQVKYPAREKVRKSILNDLSYPPNGITVKEATDALIDKFALSDEQKNAVNRSNLNVFRYSVVAPQFRQLLQKGKLAQPGGPRTRYCITDSENISPETEIEGTTRTAVDSEGNEYDIEIPATSIVKEALCNFEYPPRGIRIKDIADALAVQFELSDQQVNARHRTGYNIWANHVNTAANDLVKSGKLLKIRRGWIINPSQFEGFTPDEISPDENTLSPEVVVERSYQEIQNNLERELLQKIKDNTPEFFEQLVLDLLVKMGYGGSRADAEVVGRSGDGGIDGIINQDPLGLDRVYVQAKRWEPKISRPEVQKFTGALEGKRAKKGVFITTSNFSRKAREYVETICSTVVLIDGKQLVKLMIKYGVGVYKGKTYQSKQIDLEYFEEVEE